MVPVNGALALAPRLDNKARLAATAHISGGYLPPGINSRLSGEDGICGIAAALGRLFDVDLEAGGLHEDPRQADRAVLWEPLAGDGEDEDGRQEAVVLAAFHGFESLGYF